MKNFLATRRAWCLDADVTATASKKEIRKRDRVGPTSRTSGIGVPPAPSSKVDQEHQQEKTDVAVDYVLREIERRNKKIRDRRSRGSRRRQRHRACRKQVSIVGDAFESEARSDESDEQPNANDSENEPRDRDSGTEGAETSSPDLNTEVNTINDRVARLALAASVSTLDGLSLRGARTSHRYCPTSTAKPTSSGCKATGDTCRSSDAKGEDRGTSIFRAIRQLGLPLLMVQGTEDALIGEPLPLVFQKTVCTARV